MFEEKNKNLSLVVLLILIGFDLFLWFQILFYFPEKNVLYFLDVGEGDSSLLVLDNILVLIDAGPPGKIVQSLDKIFPKNKKYIDLAVITHPQLDHFGGFLNILDRYQFGAFIINGREGDDSKDIYKNLVEKIKENNIPIIALGAGDKILYKNNLIEVISPDKNWWSSAELNDSSLVLKIQNQDFSSLFTSDIDRELEKYLIEKFNLKSDILKIAHHGSKYSSDFNFIKEVNPSLALIGVGVNRYGHPAGEVINELKKLKIPIFRTDQDGTIYIFKKNNKFIVETKK